MRWLLLILAIVSIITAQEVEEVLICTAIQNQVAAQVTASDNCFFVAWEDYRSGASSINIYGQSVYPDGTTGGVGFAICTMISNNQTAPAIAYNSYADSFTIAWFDQRSGGTKSYARSAICTGVPESEWEIGDVTANFYSPALAFSEKFYLYTWMYNAGSDFETRYWVLDSLGNSAGSIQTLSGAGSKNPDVAFNGYEFLIVWEDSTAGGEGIFGRYFDNLGSPIGSAFLIVDDDSASVPAVCGVSAAVETDARFALAWQHLDGTTGADIYAGVTSAHLSTIPIAQNAVCTKNEAQSNPDIECHGNGFLTVWKDMRPVFTSDIYARFLNLSVTPMDTSFIVCNASMSQREPRLAFGTDDAKYLCIWIDYRNGSHEDIFGGLILPPGVTVTQPDGGEEWNVGSDYEITWVSSSVESVKIEYSTNSGASWVSPPIITSTPSDGSYMWTIPDNVSTSCLLKITAIGDTSMWDVSNSTFEIAPADPLELVGELMGISNGSKVEVSGDFAYIPGRHNGILNIIQIDVMDKSNPVFNNETEIPDFAYGTGLEIIDTLVCVSTSNNKLRLFYIQTDTLEPIGNTDIPGYGHEIVGIDTIIFVAANDSISSILISDPTNPTRIGGFDPSGFVEGLHLKDTILLASESNTMGGSRMRILKINNPVSLGQLGSVTLPGYGKDVGGDYTTNYVFEADGVRNATTTGLMFSIDISTVFLPSKVDSFVAPGATIQAIYVDGDYAYLANDTLGVRVIDITDPTDLTEIYHIDTGYDAIDVFAALGYLYVLTDSSLQIYRINIGGPRLDIVSWEYYDSSDGDGHFEPGETLALEVVLQSTGTEAVQSAWISDSIIAGDAHLILPDSFWLGDIAPGVAETLFFFIVIDESAATPSQLRTSLGAHSENAGNPSTIATAQLECNPLLDIYSWEFFDSTDGDGHFEPGETLALQVVLQNNGFSTVIGAWIENSVLSGEASIILPDSFWFGDMLSGAMDTVWFFIKIDDGAATPAQIEILLDAHSENDGNPVDTAIADINTVEPVLAITAWAFNDSSDGDGHFEPGETLALEIIVENIGLDTVRSAWLRNSMLSGEASIMPPDSIWLGNIAPSIAETLYSFVKVNDDAATPSQIEVRIYAHSSTGGNPMDTAYTSLECNPVLEIVSWAFFDSSDCDGHFEPGETLALRIMVENTGFSNVIGVWIDDSLLTGDVSLLAPDSIWLGDMQQNAVDTEFFFIAIDAGAAVPSTIEMQIHAHSENDGEPTDTATTSVEYNPVLEIASWAFFDSSDGDGNFEPGETLALRVVVENTGFSELIDVWLMDSLITGDAVLLGEDSVWFGNIIDGAVCTAFFFIEIDVAAAAPSEILIQLHAYSGNDGAPIDTAIAAIVSGTGGFRDDVESGPGGWTATANWHIASWDASSPSNSWYCGEILFPLYGEDCVDTLTSDWIILPEDNSRVVFHHRYNTEDNNDYAYIDLGTAATWNEMDSFTATSYDWERWAYTFGSLGEGDSFRIRFRFESDANNAMNGWWIDDIYSGPAQDADLWGARCFPNVALDMDSIEFSIFYQRDDGTYPTSARVIVGDSIFELSTIDLDPSNGAFYAKKVMLPPWNYSHHYKFDIPEGTVRFPRNDEIEGPFVNDTVVFFWNFESESHASGSGIWEWGAPTSGPMSAPSGSNVWATVLGGNYPPGNVSTIVFDPFDLTELEHPHLRIWIWYRMQSRTGRLYCRDVAMARLITESGDTLFLNQIYEYPRGSSRFAQVPVNGKPVWGDNDAGNFWHPVQFDLSPWVGETIEMAITFGSDGTTQEAGVYIDNMMLIAEFDEPQILSFTLNGEDSVIINYDAFERGQYVIGDVDDSIAVMNIGNTALDFALRMAWWENIYFSYIDSNCYSCFASWAQFSSSLPQPDSASFVSPDNWISSDSLIFSTATYFGDAGWNLIPDEQHFLWFMIRTPEYFSYDTLRSRVLMKAVPHIE